MDWLLLVLILAFAFQGLLSGLVSQFVGIIGFCIALWAATIAFHWLSTQWAYAYPRLLFSGLKYMIVIAGAIAVISVFRWVGSVIQAALKKTPVGWIDRPLGFVLGTGVGYVVVCVLVMTTLLAPVPRPIAESAAHSRMTRPMLERAGRACAWGTAHTVPGSQWLRKRILAAERRADRLAGRP